MPLYEYYCSTCRTRFEQLVRAPDEGAEATCPSCGRRNVPRVLSTFAAVRRGGDGAELATAAHGGCCGAGGCGCGA
ncbi:MAG TPA: zinc ribbon domain-containing protein [Chloroflexota bacterium]|jgi:putative FmdB family regulatory protein|nr:zinc ribbon domain-containing protein [Chloroflexota bacterium]